MRKCNNTLILSAKIVNIISGSLMSVAGILLMVLTDVEGLTAQRIILGILFGLTGVAKLVGYFSNDLYRLAFQHDLATGVFCIIMCPLVIFTPASMYVALPLLITAYVLLDALLRFQMAFDAKGFGMKSWVIILASAAILGAAALFSLVSILTKLLRPFFAVGLAFLLDGIENTWITAHTVRIRAKKKNFEDRFDLKK